MGKMFKNLLLGNQSQFKANIALMVLAWWTYEITSADPDLHPRWLPSDQQTQF